MLPIPLRPSARLTLARFAGGVRHETTKPPPAQWKRFWHEAVRFMHNENGQAPEDIPPRPSAPLYFLPPHCCQVFLSKSKWTLQRVLASLLWVSWVRGCFSFGPWPLIISSVKPKVKRFEDIVRHTGKPLAKAALQKALAQRQEMIDAIWDVHDAAVGINRGEPDRIRPLTRPNRRVR